MEKTPPYLPFSRPHQQHNPPGNSNSYLTNFILLNISMNIWFKCIGTWDIEGQNCFKLKMLQSNNILLPTHLYFINLKMLPIIKIVQNIQKVCRSKFMSKIFIPKDLLGMSYLVFQKTDCLLPNYTLPAVLSYCSRWLHSTKS